MKKINEMDVREVIEELNRVQAHLDYVEGKRNFDVSEFVSGRTKRRKLLVTRLVELVNTCEVGDSEE